MKKTTKAKKPATLRPGQTFQPIAVTDALAPSSRKDNGANDFATNFAIISNFVMANQETFGIENFYQLRADIPVPVINELFSKWVHRMKLAGRIKQIPSSYDTPRFEIV